MHVDVRQAGEVILVDLEGRLMAGNFGDELLHNVMNELVGEGYTKIILNLSKVKKIDSSGIGELVAGIRMAAKLGTAVKLVNVEPKVLKILELSQILPLLKIYDTEEEAVAAFEESGSEAAAQG